MKVQVLNSKKKVEEEVIPVLITHYVQILNCISEMSDKSPDEIKKNHQDWLDFALDEYSEEIHSSADCWSKAVDEAYERVTG